MNQMLSTKFSVTASGKQNRPKNGVKQHLIYSLNSNWKKTQGKIEL